MTTTATMTVHRHPTPVSHAGADHDHGSCSKHAHWAGGTHDEPIDGAIGLVVDVDIVVSTPLNDPAGHAIRGRHYRATVAVTESHGLRVLRVYVEGPGLLPGTVAWTEATESPASVLIETARDNARRLVAMFDRAESARRGEAR